MSKGALEDQAHRDRFERSKAFSDYLGFHIRATFFLLIGMFALVIPASSLLAEANGGPQYRATDYLLEISVMLFCFSLSLTMLYHVFGVGRSYLRVKISYSFIRRLVYPIYCAHWWPSHTTALFNWHVLWASTLPKSSAT